MLEITYNNKIICQIEHLNKQILIDNRFKTEKQFLDFCINNDVYVTHNLVVRIDIIQSYLKRYKTVFKGLDK